MKASTALPSFARVLAPVLAPVLAGALGACFSHHETIDVRADGSVTVEVRASGAPHAFAGSEPLPLGSPWVPATDDTKLWLASVGPVTRGDEVTRTLEDERSPFAERDRITLAARATFHSVEDLPRRYAPAGTPEREAGLERDATLEIRRAGGRTEYAFERTIRARPNAYLRIVRCVAEQIDPELERRLEDESRVPAYADVARATEVLRVCFARFAASVAGDALASVPPDRLALDAARTQALVSRISDAAGAIVTFELVIRLFTEDDDSVPAAEHPFSLLYLGMRAAIADTLADGLAREGAPEEARAAVLASVERELASMEAAAELIMQSFSVGVRLPGEIVSGNHDRVADGRAFWSFASEDLEQDFVMRLVSVVE